MFDQLSAFLGGPNVLFAQHPQSLSRWLEEAWVSVNLPTGSTGTLDDILGDATITNAIALSAPPSSGFGFPGSNPFVWKNLLYSYILESTGVVEVMAEVLRRNAVGETLDVPTVPAQQWLRSTEELFFRDPPLFQAMGVGSHIRRFGRESRRGAYWRMFGLDLPFPVPARWADPQGGQPWKLDVGAGVNDPFRRQWTEFLRQAWVGIQNRRNLVGANATDAALVSQLCRALGDMLRMRRQGGQLAREEAAYVAMLSWFDVTLSENTPIVDALNATAANPEGRLARIAQKVGMTPTARSRELFQLAAPASQIIRMIELHEFDTAAGAGALFPVVPTALSNTINEVIDLWQDATGDMLKEQRVDVAAVGGRAVPSPSPSSSMLPSTSVSREPAGVGGNGRAR